MLPMISDVEQPKDTNGEEIPLETEFLYDVESGKRVEVMDYSFFPTSGKWRAYCPEIGKALPTSYFSMKEVNAALPLPTCEQEPCGCGVWRCSHCGAFVRRGSVMDCCGAIQERFCPNCGAKIVEGEAI